MNKKRKLSKLIIMLTIMAFTASLMLVNIGIADTTKTDAPTVKVEKDTKVEKAKEKTNKTTKDLTKIKGSDKKGKYFYKKTCKSCHGKKDEGGEVTPVSKTTKQWQRFFKKDKHFRKAEKTHKLSTEFDAEQLIHIKTFLINHAADSDQPETCG